MAIKFHKVTALPSSPTPADDGVYFVQQSGYYATAVIDNGVVHLINVPETNEFIMHVWGESNEGPRKRDVQTLGFYNMAADESVTVIGTSYNNIIDPLPILSTDDMAIGMTLKGTIRGIHTRGTALSAGGNIRIYIGSLFFTISLAGIGTNASTPLSIDFEVDFMDSIQTARKVTVSGVGHFQGASTNSRMTVFPVSVQTVNATSEKGFEVKFAGTHSADSFQCDKCIITRAQVGVIKYLINHTYSGGGGGIGV